MPEKKIAMSLSSTKVCAHRSHFQCEKFLYVFFIFKKRPLFVNFSIPPSAKWFFLQCSTSPVTMRICGHVPNSPMNRNPKRLIPYICQKWIFGPPKLYCTSRAWAEKTFWWTLNVMILQTVRNECLRFGGHIDIEVSYKILQLDVLKKTPTLQNPPCFE
jgi:hypothetical protein